MPDRLKCYKEWTESCDITLRSYEHVGFRPAPDRKLLIRPEYGCASFLIEDTHPLAPVNKPAIEFYNRLKYHYGFSYLMIDGSNTAMYAAAIYGGWELEELMLWRIDKGRPLDSDAALKNWDEAYGILKNRESLAGRPTPQKKPFYGVYLDEPYNSPYEDRDYDFIDVYIDGEGPGRLRYEIANYREEIHSKLHTKLYVGEYTFGCASPFGCFNRRRDYFIGASDYVVDDSFDSHMDTSNWLPQSVCNGSMWLSMYKDVYKASGLFGLGGEERTDEDLKYLMYFASFYHYDTLFLYAGNQEDKTWSCGKAYDDELQFFCSVAAKAGWLRYTTAETSQRTFYCQWSDCSMCDGIDPNQDPEGRYWGPTPLPMCPTKKYPTVDPLVLTKEVRGDVAVKKSVECEDLLNEVCNCLNKTTPSEQSDYRREKEEIRTALEQFLKVRKIG